MIIWNNNFKYLDMLLLNYLLVKLSFIKSDNFMKFKQKMSIQKHIIKFLKA